MRWLPCVAVLVAIAAAGCEPPPPESPAPGAFQCLGLPSSQCQDMLVQAREENPGRPIVSARIRCTVVRCSEVSGQAEIEILFADGGRSVMGTGWEQAVGGPPQEPATAAPEPVTSDAP